VSFVVGGQGGGDKNYLHQSTTKDEPSGRDMVDLPGGGQSGSGRARVVHRGNRVVLGDEVRGMEGREGKEVKADTSERSE